VLRSDPEASVRIEINSRKLIKLLKDAGYYEDGVEGSHHHFKHPTRPGKIQVPHPKKDLPHGTARGIMRDAGLLNKE
jgi:predicted RNA binding protein YcfA (HicA-like mRNA interferase family)